MIRTTAMIKTATAILLAAGSAAAWGQATIDLDSPSGNTLTTGQVVTLDLSGNNWSVPLDGGALDLSFNPAVLSLQSVTIDTTVFDLASIIPLPNATIDNTAGTATGIEFFTLFNTAQGNFHIADLTFVADGPGSANLGLSENAAIGLASLGSPLTAGVDFSFATADLKVTSGMVGPVPEPPTIWLMAGAALLAFAMRGRLSKLVSMPA